MKIVQGNLIDLAFNNQLDVIVHGCNCMVTMGKGIAKEIRSRIPEAYEADCFTKPGDRSKLGTFSSAIKHRPDGTYFIVVNAYTQYDYRPSYNDDGISRADYDAINSVFTTIGLKYPNLRIGYPKIGCGLAGGNWETVTEIIDRSLDGLDHTYVEFVQC